MQMDPNRTTEEESNQRGISSQRRPKLFSKVRQFTSGLTSQVWEVKRNADGQHFAMKKLRRSKKWSGLLFESETSILHLLNHPGIVRMEDAFIDEKYYYILTELGKMDMFEKIRSEGLTEDSCRAIIRKILETLQFIHERNLVHRDLKPENIVFSANDPDQPIMIDFADAICVDRKKMYTELVGTKCYLAPERLREHSGAELMKSDVWAVGVMAYEMMTNKRCFYASSEKNLYKKIVAGSWHWPRRVQSLSPEFQSFVESLLTVDPSHRLSAAEALSHPWLDCGDEEMEDTVSDVSFGTWMKGMIADETYASTLMEDMAALGWSPRGTGMVES